MLTVVSGVALAFALIAFVLGSGPLTSALLLAVIALPAAAATACLGRWRMALAAAYWAVAALCAVPAARIYAIQVDRALLILAVGGIALTAVLVAGFAKSRARDQRIDTHGAGR